MTAYRHLELRRADPEELVGVIDGSEMRHRVLPGGELTVRLDQARLGRGWLQRGRYGMGVLAQGALPAGVITIGGMLRSPADTVINGFLCPPGSLQVHAEHCELHYRAAPHTTWIAYCIDRATLQEAALRLFGELLPLPACGSQHVRPRPAMTRRLAATIEALFAAERWPARADPARASEDRLLFDVVSALLAGRPGASTDRDLLRAEQRRRLMERAEEYLRAHLAQPFALGAFADAVGVSHRMLEYHFRRSYGVSPLAWHRSMRLDAVRRDLRLARRRGESVTTVALRWGFTHFGRFAEEYRRLYGERPIDTLRAS